MGRPWSPFDGVCNPPTESDVVCEWMMIGFEWRRTNGLGTVRTAGAA